MVPIVRLFRNLPALFALVCATTGQGADTIYRKVGDSVVLNPGQPFNAISSATWKHNTDLASEWFGTGNVDCYRDFKDRCSLNKKDGSFTISNLKVEDSGIYTPEINDKVLNALKLQVIKPVPKPTVSVKCNNEKTRCNLTCEANISADVGTVTYEWRTGEEVLSNNKELIITENKESSFICELENRVSSSSSDGVDNPLSRGNPGAAAGLAVAIVFLIVAPALAVIGRFGWYWLKNRKFPTWKEFWCCGKKKAKGQYAPVPEQGRNISGYNEEDEQFHLASETLTRDPTGQYTPVSIKDTITKKNHEPNRGGPADIVQTINENEDKTSPGDNKKADGTNISVSSEKDDLFYNANEALTSGPTEGEASPSYDKKKDDQGQKSPTIPANENPGEQHRHLNPEGETRNQSDSETKTNYHEPNARQSTPTVENTSKKEGEATPSDDEDTDDQHQKSAEDPSIQNPGDSKTGGKPTEGSENNQDDKKKDDQGQKLPTIPANENQGEQHRVFSPEEKTRKQSEDNAGSAEENELLNDDNKKSGLEAKTSDDQEPNGGWPTETGQNVNENKGEASLKDNEEKDDQDEKLPTIPSNENPREQHRHLNPEGETRNQFENNQDGDNQQGKQLFPGVTSKTANDETNISVSSEEAIWNLHPLNLETGCLYAWNISVSGEEDEQFYPHSDTVTSGPTEN